MRHPTQRLRTRNSRNQATRWWWLSRKKRILWRMIVERPLLHKRAQSSKVKMLNLSYKFNRSNTATLSIFSRNLFLGNHYLRANNSYRTLLRKNHKQILELFSSAPRNQNHKAQANLTRIDSAGSVTSTIRPNKLTLNSLIPLRKKRSITSQK